MSGLKHPQAQSGSSGTKHNNYILRDVKPLMAVIPFSFDEHQSIHAPAKALRNLQLLRQVHTSWHGRANNLKTLKSQYQTGGELQGDQGLQVTQGVYISTNR